MNDYRYVRAYVQHNSLHLDRPFDYWNTTGREITPGSLLRVPFHGASLDAWAVSHPKEPAVEEERLVEIDYVLDIPPVMSASDMSLFKAVAARYGSSVSSVLRHCMPYTRTNYVENELRSWLPPNDLPASKPFESEVIHLSRPWAERVPDGLLGQIEQVVKMGLQVLVLTPIPRSYICDGIVREFQSSVDDLRSKGNHADIYRSFWRWRLGHTQILIGTTQQGLWSSRGGALGLVICLDEPNPTYKQRKAPRAHMREVSMIRSRTHDCRVVLVSDVPSASVIRLLGEGHIRSDSASIEDMRKFSPTVEVVDRKELSPKNRRTKINEPIHREIDKVLANNGNVIVLAAMLGSGRILGCGRCKKRHECPECFGGVVLVPMADGSLPPVKEATQWVCSICETKIPRSPCVICEKDEPTYLLPGVKAIGKDLQKTYPESSVAIMEGFDAPGPRRVSSGGHIAVMTRGSVVDNPKWLQGKKADLGVIADANVLLSLPDFGASEDALRLWVDLAKLVDRLYVQTYELKHHALEALKLRSWQYFWERELLRRTDLSYPPYGNLIRFEKISDEQVQQAQLFLPNTPIFGPDEDGNAFLSTTDFRSVLEAIRPIREEWALAGLGTRFEVDPLNI